jgi:hypothetical protein
MSQLQHEYANEVGMIANVPQFQVGNAIIAALTQINTRLGVIDRRLDGIDGRLDGIDGRLDGMERQQQIR